MRVAYVPISEKQWLLHYQRGGGFRGTSFQRGGGLGSIFRILFRAILPLVKSAGKAVGKRALKTGAEVASDLISGRDLKHSLTTHGKQAAGELLDKATKKMQGGNVGSIKGKRKPRKATKQKLVKIGKRRVVKTQLGKLRF